MLRPLLFVVATALPIAAQGLLPSPIQPVGDRIAATANSGLQVATDGPGLIGGGCDYRVRFDEAGVRYEPALGSSAPTTRFVHMAAIALHRGGQAILTLPSGSAPVANDKRATYAHAAGIAERYDVRPEGVALSWQFAERPAGSGDLVVRYAVHTDLGAPIADERGLSFSSSNGGVHIDGVTGIDARGASVRGSINWVDGGIELSLPAAFIDTASYPLVLDPLIGTQINVSVGLTYDDGEPDAAYDAGTGRFLVVWRRTFSATNIDVRGQMVFATGQLAGSTIFFGSSGTVSPPRVANIGGNDRFGVVWSQLVGTTSTVQFQAVATPSGALDAITALDTTTTSVHGPADIGSDPEAQNGSGRGCCVVWEDEDFDAIRMQRVYYFSNGSLGLAGQFAVFLDGLLGPSYKEPSLSRAASADGWLLLAVTRRNPLSGSSAIEARMIKVDGSLVGIIGTVASSSNDDLFTPDVDGY
ncbi:MAG: hypothetical protein ABIP94_15960, partial [Planctomycetota bacterium]